MGSTDPLLSHVPAATSLVQLLQHGVDSTIISNLETEARMLRMPRPFSSQVDGYKNRDVIRQAVLLGESVRTLADDDNEADWIRLLHNLVWTYFQLTESFSHRYACQFKLTSKTSSEDELWKDFDVPIKQLIPARANLITPKPDFAFGLKYKIRSAMYNKVRLWENFSIPSVNLFVTCDVAMPFLVFESTSSAGTLRATENRPANSVIKAHDLLCSLNV